MPLNLQQDTTITGPALPEPFVKLNLEAEIRSLLPPSTGEEAAALRQWWSTYRNHLRLLVSQGGPRRVQNQVIEPLLDCPGFGYRRLESAGEVRTREGTEDGGAFLVSESGDRLRFYAAGLEEDLDAPARRGEAYRFSLTKIASRVLLSQGERLALLTNGSELRLLICDPARTDSTIVIAVDPSWKRSREIPDSFRLFFALASPAGVRALPDLIEKARLQQAKVTKDLRLQARHAVEQFLQAVFDHPENREALAAFPDKTALARRLWREGLITVYRLLFVLKLEATDDPAKCFSFASGSLWRNTFSPGVALAPLVRELLDRGTPTGSLLEDGLRALFRLLGEGLQCTELNVRPMAGALFSPESTPLLSRLRWSEEGVAHLLDQLLWTTARRGTAARERVHYGPLDVEDLGRVYEALLELDPGFTTAPMCRLRRAKLEVVVPAAQGERYRPQILSVPSDPSVLSDDEEDTPEAEEDTPSKKTKVEWIEHIPPGRFFLRVGLGRKATGSFYTPHSFVRFLVQETLGPLVERVSPRDDPQPSAILALKVVDKAMGSGHFLVEACRFLGDALYEACRRCDDLAAQATLSAESYRTSRHDDEAAAAEARAADLLARVEALPDPEDELLRYMPSRSVEGTATGYSLARAISLCRRMVAVHCLYGVDKNPLAVELAKLSLWIECHAEGLPLTFLDHRLVTGDSLTGPFFEHLLTYPGSREPLNDLFSRGLKSRLSATLTAALQHVRDLEQTVGLSEADIQNKLAAKSRLDRALAPFRLLAAAWSGGVMLGGNACDDPGYAALARRVAESDGDLSTLSPQLSTSEALRAMIATGLGLPADASAEDILAAFDPARPSEAIPAFSYDLGFPEVFYPTGDVNDRRGFDVDMGNPPWDKPLIEKKAFVGGFDVSFIEAGSMRTWESAANELISSNPAVRTAWQNYSSAMNGLANIATQLYPSDSSTAAQGHRDLYMYFCRRAFDVVKGGGFCAFLTGGGLHYNVAAVETRRLILSDNSCKYFLQFDNKKRIFDDLPPIVEFCTFVATKSAAGNQITKVGLKLTTIQDVVSESHVYEIRASELSSLAGENLVIPLKSSPRIEGERLAAALLRSGVDLTAEADPAKDEHHVALSELGINIDGKETEAQIAAWTAGVAVFRSGRSIEQFEDKPLTKIDRWSTDITSGIRLSDPRIRKAINAVRFFRLATRRTCGSPKSNQRSLIACLMPPGNICSDKLMVERSPGGRPTIAALVALTIWNSFTLDSLARPTIGTTFGISQMTNVPFPKLSPPTATFLAHAALRLTCNHTGYEPLWREQVGEAWREAGPAFTWPVLSGDDTRWAVRAAIDAVVAAAYGLTRDQYAHVLSTFSHASYKPAPARCLAAFDELQSLSLAAFTQKHDPYHDIPLNESLPQPVITLPIPAAAAESSPYRASRKSRRKRLPYETPDLFD